MGSIHSYAGGKIEDTGPLTKKRMETVDDETSDAAIDFIKKQHKAGKPWFVWWNGTRMHFRTHVKKELRGISGQDEYSDGMVEHDMQIGELLDLLECRRDVLAFCILGGVFGEGIDLPGSMRSRERLVP